MEQKQKPPRNHTERGIIDYLADHGYISHSEDGGLWFNKLFFDSVNEQIDLRFIEQECNKTYRYLERMGADVYKCCRFISSVDEQHIELFNKLLEAINKTHAYKRDMILGGVAGVLVLSLIWIAALWLMR